MIITNGKGTEFCARKWKNRSEKRKKNEDKDDQDDTAQENDNLPKEWKN